MTKKWKWISEDVVKMTGEIQVMKQGGLSGLRDEALLDSALSRPKNLAAYDNPDVFDLAAAYAYGIISNHPFLDGNKRTGFLTACAFMDENGWEYDATEVDAYMTVMALAQKEIDEKTFAIWLKKSSKRIKKTKKEK
ncbi:MAG: type II toxin-antitoxin system death-on-curing family toxin [Bdellovibrionales bacterium]|jgi:death-on-curing protein